MKYKAISFALVVAILPSILGVHIFQHHCTGCDEDETITRIITTMHDHEHACSDCTCEHACQSCAEEVGNHVHHLPEDGACKHEFKKASFDAQTTAAKIKFEASAVDLLFNNNLYADVLSELDKPLRLHYDVIQKIPDEPSPEMNCVFLL
ncbi:hypothetical protein [Carboxylicivirga marina]|uniref:Secreted protein n=1 Tax=Carboxylicivirga marina TaxID=2800988 RepID=A0ABS1HIL6_9BACT|nr:hypothetical protein [Carboxylicivirga marina]MBK3517411.1 hypothetical protein [Carboxylicivirga marina]